MSVPGASLRSGTIAAPAAYQLQGKKETAMARHEQDDSGTDRRGFLKLASLGSVATGAALVIGDEAEAAPVQTATDGYRETDHVKTYYASARF